MTDRVVITGYGAITPLGLNVEDTWQALIAGKSGVGRIKQFDTTDYSVKIAAEVKDFNPLDYLDPTTVRYTDRFTQFALVASQQAIDMSKILINESNRNNIGIIIGSGIGGVDTALLQVDRLKARGPTRVSPYTIPMMILDSAASMLSIQTGIRGPNLSLVSSCSTGTDAIGMAYKMVKYGDCPVMIAGGSDAAINQFGLAGFTQAGALSRNTKPEKASRPFDAKRDGFVLGEGAAVLVLESLDYALSRGATIIAEIIGYGGVAVRLIV